MYHFSQHQIPPALTHREWLIHTGLECTPEESIRSIRSLAASHMESTKSPDYAALVKLLPTLKHPVDAVGEVILTPGETEKIQRFGFTAHPGRWPVPPIPPELVAGNGLLEHLASRWDPFWALRRSDEEPVEATHAVLSPDAAVPAAVSWALPAPPTNAGVAVGVGQPDLHDQHARLRTDLRDANARSTAKIQILRLLERHGGQMRRRLLQQKCWRRTAEEFNEALGDLIERQVVVEEGPIIRVARAVKQAS